MAERRAISSAELKWIAAKVERHGGRRPSVAHDETQSVGPGAHRGVGRGRCVAPRDPGRRYHRGFDIGRTRSHTIHLQDARPSALTPRSGLFFALSPRWPTLAFVANNAGGIAAVGVLRSWATAGRLAGAARVHAAFLVCGQPIDRLRCAEVEKGGAHGRCPADLARQAFTTSRNLESSTDDRVRHDDEWLYVRRRARRKPVDAGNHRRPAETHRWPQFLPDGRHFLFRVAIGRLETRGTTTSLASRGGTPTRVLQDDTAPCLRRPTCCWSCS